MWRLWHTVVWHALEMLVVTACVLDICRPHAHFLGLALLFDCNFSGCLVHIPGISNFVVFLLNSGFIFPAPHVAAIVHVKVLFFSLLFWYCGLNPEPLASQVSMLPINSIPSPWIQRHWSISNHSFLGYFTLLLILTVSLAKEVYKQP